MMKAKLSLLTVLVSVFLVACGSSSKDLPELPSFQPSITVQEIWNANAGDGIGDQAVLLSPVITEDLIVSADYEGKVTANDLTTGKRIWRKDTDKPFTSNLSAGAGKVFIGTSSAEVLALEAKSGKIAWKAEVPNQVFAAPGLGESVLLVKAIDGQLDALNIETGQLVWSYSNNDPSLVLRGGSAPQIADGKVIAGFGNGKLLALNLNDGQLVWEKSVAQAEGTSPLERMVDIDVDPIVRDGVIYVATYQGKVAALNLNTGAELWSHDISAYTGMVLESGNLIVSDASGDIWAFRAADGTVIWKQTALEGRMISAPALQANAVVVTDKEGYIHWLSREDGTFLARTKVTSEALLANPVVANNTVFVESVNGDLYAYQIAGAAKSQ